jgi:putative zinc finger/helix-turn-helix YgiT family protein
MTMDQKKFCPKCDKTRPVKTIKREETLTVRETPIKIVSALTECSACHEAFATEAQEEENVRKAYDEYRRQKALLSPSEVRDVRASYGLSQTGLSQWLGWGEITIHRYESGGMQDAAHNETLMLLKDPRNAKKLLEKHRDNLDSATAAGLEKRISELLDSGVARLIEDDLAAALAMVEPSEFNGYRRFDVDRFENLVLYVLEKAGANFKTAINKFLWYIDFGYFQEQTRSITGSQYLRFPHGPIPKSYDFLFAGMVEKAWMEMEEVIAKDYSGERFTAKVTANTDLFEGGELKAIDRIITALKGRSSKQLSDMAHKESAYVVTKDRQPISYRHANDLKFTPSAAKARKTA